MKTILISALFGLIVVGAAHGQANTVDSPPCNEDWCKEKRYSYRFCDQYGRMVEKCSNDPNNDKEFNPALRPAKRATPLCLRWDFSNLEFSSLIIDPSDPLHQGENVVIFDMLDMPDLLKQAEREWTWQCPAQGPNAEYDYCCLNVRFSSPATDFGGLPVDRTRGFLYDPVEAFVGGPRYCQTDCYRSELVINSEEEFMQRDENGVPRIFFFTRNLPRLQQLRPDLQYASALDILRHELGHWLGLGHASGFDSFGKYCGSPGSIMEKGFVGDWVQVERGITPEDQCAFMKLYCCASTADKLDVEEEAVAGAKKFAFQVAPNPLHADILNVTLSESLLQHVTRLRVMNSVGEVMLDRPLAREEWQTTIEVPDWANGVYFVQIVHEEGVAGQKVIIQR